VVGRKWGLREDRGTEDSVAGGNHQSQDDISLGREFSFVEISPSSVEHLWIPLWNFSGMPTAEGHATDCIIIGHPAGVKNQSSDATG
jgi:hypothetical protein